MPDESLLTDEVRALVGLATESVEVEVASRHVRRAMDLFLGRMDRSFAAGERVPGYVLVALVSEAEGVDLPQVMPDSILISNEMQFERPLLMGERLVLRSRIADISERFGGRFGYSLYFRTETEAFEPGGTSVARTAQTMMYYDATSATGEGEA